MSFATALPVVLRHEGGYVNNPSDTGGETFRGISRRNNPDWGGWPLIDAAKRAGFTSAAAINSHFASDQRMYELAADLYCRLYYNPVARFTTRERPVDKMFDAGVNIGVGAAIRIAQRIVGSAADGAVGPMTLAAAARFFTQPGGEDIFISEFCHLQMMRYVNIIIERARRKDYSQVGFLEGWRNRALWKPPT